MVAVRFGLGFAAAMLLGTTVVFAQTALTLGTGPKAGTPGTYFPLIFDALGMKVMVRNGQSADMGIQMGDGVVDAFCFGAGLPIPIFSELDASQQINFFTWTDDEIARIRKA